MRGLADAKNVVGFSTNLVRSVRDLEVYKRAFSVSVEIHQQSLTFPKIEQYALADQLRRSSKSVCANIAEGFIRQNHSKPEFRRFLSMAMGSAGETETWIEYCQTFGYIVIENYERWSSEYRTIIKMLIKLRQSVKL